MKEQVISALRKAGRPMSLLEIQEATGEQNGALCRILREEPNIKFTLSLVPLDVKPAEQIKFYLSP